MIFCRNFYITFAGHLIFKTQSLKQEAATGKPEKLIKTIFPQIYHLQYTRFPNNKRSRFSIAKPIRFPSPTPKSAQYKNHLVPLFQRD